jgi:hypothetical protein
MITSNVLRSLNVFVDPVRATTKPFSAASGLVNIGQRLYVVADDENYLGVFDLSSKEPGTRVRLVEGELPSVPKERKRKKPDFEALALLPRFSGFPQGALLALGSGSLPQRQRAVLLALGTLNQVSVAQVIDLAPLFLPLRERFPDLNIEGAFVTEERFCLLQRGHSAAPVNAFISYSWSGVQDWLNGGKGVPIPNTVELFELGDLDGVPLCFTDGAPLIGGGWVFCAAAEDTADSYHDGVCKGSAVGIVDAQGKIQRLDRLTVLCKAEGIAVKSEGEAIELLLVTDADDPAVAACLLTTTLGLSSSAI